MEFEWINSPASSGKIPHREIEESFEDPFGIRIMPDFEDHPAAEARYFILGKSVSGRPLFSAFWTDGKRYRVIQSREMTPQETAFYDRRNSDPAH
jgi:uncharacterized protein